MAATSVDISDYDQSGYDYREYWQNRQYDNLIEHRLLKKLLPSFGNRLIDVGGGFGRLLDTYQDKFQHITILDYSKNNLQSAQSKIEAQQLHHVITQQGDIYSLPFSDNTFDMALIVRVIHHLERPSLALHEIHRILQPQGFLILQYSNKIHLKNRLKSLITRNANIINKTPLNLSEEGIFYQFHPDYIIEKLKENDFEIINHISTAHLRIPFLYNVVPSKILATMESVLTSVLGKFYLGPSVFVIARKK